MLTIVRSLSEMKFMESTAKGKSSRFRNVISLSKLYYFANYCTFLQKYF